VKILCLGSCWETSRECHLLRHGVCLMVNFLCQTGIRDIQRADKILFLGVSLRTVQKKLAFDSVDGVRSPTLTRVGVHHPPLRA
jgi:hypothetical protein